MGRFRKEKCGSCYPECGRLVKRGPVAGIKGSSRDPGSDRQGVGKPVVAKHTTTITPLSPCIILILLLQGYTVAQALSANHHTLFTLSLRRLLLPRCRRRCLQPTPLIHDQRIRRCVSETYLTDKSGYNCSFAASTVCRVSEHIDWFFWLLPSPGAWRWIVPVPSSAMSASSSGSVGTIHWQRSTSCLQTRWAPSSRGVAADESLRTGAGHRCRTVIMDAERTRVPVVGHGNKAGPLSVPSSSSASDASRLRRWRWT